MQGGQCPPCNRKTYEPCALLRSSCAGVRMARLFSDEIFPSEVKTMRRSLFVRSMSVFLTLVMLIGILPMGMLQAKADEVLEVSQQEEDSSVVIDFKQFAIEAQQQPFWNDLCAAAGENTKYIGLNTANGSMTAAQSEAYAAMRSWMEETYGWTIDENASGFEEHFKRLYINADDASKVPFGVSMYTYYHGSAYPDRSKLALTMQADAEGWYTLDLTAFKQASSWPHVSTTTGNSSGGDRISVYVNGKEACHDYSLYQGPYDYVTVTEKMGAVYLGKGENSVVIDSLYSYTDASVGGRSNVPLNSLVFKKVEPIVLVPELERTLNISQYLGYGAAEVTAQTHTIVSTDEDVVTGAIDEDGNLFAVGVDVGTAELALEYDGQTLFALPVEVYGATDGEQTEIKLDFKTFAQEAAQQPWWNDLHPAAGESTKYIGVQNSSDSMSEAELAAYDAMTKWSEQTYGWHIDESVSGFDRYWKRLYINSDAADKVPWGVNMYTYYHGDVYPDRSKLALTVTAEGSGWYNLKMSAFMAGSNWQGSMGTTGMGSGGDRIAVYVNGGTVYYDYALYKDTGPDVLETVSLGAVYLNKGENSIVIDSILSYNDTATAGRSNMPLNNLTFEPLTGVSVQEYLSETIDLHETYIPFDEKTDGYSAVSSNDWIATATINSAGLMTVTGITQGEAKISVMNGTKKICTIPVTVSVFEGGIDELNGSSAKLDFMTVADRAEEQSWWETLDSAGENAKSVTPESAELTAWLRENTRWDIASVEDTLTIHGGDAAYGLGVSGKAVLNVDLPAEGLYNVTVEYLQGGTNADILINGETLFEALNTSGSTAVVRRSLGTAVMNKGQNTIGFEAEGEVRLRAVTFTPLGVWQTEADGQRYIALNETYLPFDAEINDGYTVRVSDTSVATAEIDADADLILYGRMPGETTVTVSDNGTDICTLRVKVVEKGDIRELDYLLGGFRAQTLELGAVAKGEITGLTTKQTPLTEKQLRRYGAVYFVSSNTNAAVVDQNSGDITCVGEGEATVTAYALLDGVTVSNRATVVVTDDTDLTGVNIFSSVDYLGTGNVMQLYVEGTKASGANADMGKYPVSWSVDDETVATITSDGRLTGLCAGTVTVTATAGVQGMPVIDTMQIKVVENSLLPAGDIVLQFNEGRAIYVLDWTLEKDGIRLDRERTVNGGEGLLYSANGIRYNCAIGEGFVIDFVVRKSGWYKMDIQGQYQASIGGPYNVFVDDSYMGELDSTAPSTYGAAVGKVSSIWLDAGVHTVEVLAAKKCDVMLGRIMFSEISNPGETEISLNAEKTQLVAGESTEVTVTMKDGNGNAVYALQQSAVPDFTNYYILTSSAPNVVAVSGSTLRAKSAGTAVITMKGEINGEAVTRELTITVTKGSFASAQLSAEKATVKPDSEPVQLLLTTYDASGNVQQTLPGGIHVSYESADTSIAEVSQSGLVTVTGKLGSALITATLTEGDRIVQAQLWITVNATKTEPTVYTYEERAIAQENVLKYDWAWQEKEAAVKQADYYVENLDAIYDSWIPDTFPRSSQVGLKTDPNYRYCRYCGVDLVKNYHAYPYLVDTIENPWKITCPACRRDFPSNDFESYYKSGLGEDGKFHKELADPQYLVNELYPEMGEGWGVDDGWGYDALDGSVHTYIAYYLHCVFTGLSGGRDKHNMEQIFTALGNAYLYTGDEKYGNAGAILVDRLADIYPDYDIYQHGVNAYALPDGGSGRGKFVGQIWDGILSRVLAKTVDTFWPAAENPEVIAYLQSKADVKGVEPEIITPDYLRTRAEDNILLAIYDNAKTGWIMGNFGISESAVAYAAHTLNRLPESQEMVDWVFNTELLSGAGYNYSVAGGDVMLTLVNKIGRDGLAHEGSFSYNAMMEGYLLDLADALDGFDIVEGADLWKNQKFVNMYSGQMRFTICGRLTPQVHESGSVQSTNFMPNLDYMTTAFVKSGDPEIARAIYAANGNTANGLHADIFTKDPESGLRTQIRQIVAEKGEWDMSDSDMLAGYGIAILREGPEKYLSSNAHQFSDYWIGFGYTNTGHAQLEMLNLDLEAFGLNLSSSMGYPTVVNAQDAERMQWDRNTISNNTVVVDDKAQTPMDEGGFPRHFEDAGKAKVIDIEADGAYEETDIYRRTLVAVENGDGVHYAVDFFRILGGSEHVYSFHGATTKEPTLEGLDMVQQAMGTYAGPDIPYGYWQTGSVAGAYVNTGSGYSWLDDVYRDDSPERTFSVDWAIEDFNHRLPTTAGIHLKLTMLSEEPMTEVALADGHPPRNTKNPDHLEYVLVRRSGEEGMDTLFTSILEPYQGSFYIAHAELVAATLTDGTEKLNDKAAAVKVTLTSGRTDYIVYATNPNCTYRIDDNFDFRGFTGVVSYEADALTYAWGNEAKQVANVIEDAQSAVTGTVTDFTQGLSMDGYTMTIRMDEAVSAESLVDRYIYVNNDGVENAAYRIYDAEVQGDTAVLNLRHLTLVREWVDPYDLEKGYKHNVSVGDTYTIPLSEEFDLEELFTHTTDKVVMSGSKLSLTTGVKDSGVVYEAEDLPYGAKLVANGTLTWMPSKTQTGRYPITIKAVCDGDVIGTMSFVVYVVNYTGSTYAPDVCAHSKAVTYEADGVVETVCPACGNVSKTEKEPEEIRKIDIAGSNMTLGNELKLNVLVKTSDLCDGTYTAKITRGDTVTEAVFTKYNSTYHYVTVSMTAKQMADVISVVVYDENGNEVSNVYETSIRAYAMRVLTSTTATAEMKTLAVDMLNYGAEAQLHFGYNTDDLANSLLTEEQKALATDAVSCSNKQVKGANFYGANLRLEDRIVFNLFFKNCKADMYAKVTYTDYAGRVHTIEKTLVQHSGSTYKVVVDDVVLADAFSMVTVTVYNADGTVHGTATDSVESYCARAGESALNDAIMKFAYSAKAYLS